MKRILVFICDMCGLRFIVDILNGQPGAENKAKFCPGCGSDLIYDENEAKELDND